MSYLDASSGAVVSQLSVDQRAGFIRRTYAHVAMAIGFMAIACYFFLASGIAPAIAQVMFGGTINMLVSLGLFIGAGVLAEKWARSEMSRTLHYAALLGYAFVEALILTPVLLVASVYDPAAIPDAAICTAALVAALSYIAFTTKKDFSFLGPFLAVGFIVALGACVASMIFGFSFGVIGSAAIVMLAAGSVLYQTSNIIHHYQEHQHVAAALGLFASIALMFRFLLQMFMAFGDD